MRRDPFGSAALEEAARPPAWTPGPATSPPTGKSTISRGDSVKRLFPGLLCAVFLSGVASAQKPAVPGAQMPQATTVDSEEIRAAVEGNDAGAFSDTVLRVVPIKSEYNVGVAVVRRSKVDGQTPRDAVVHDAITEVYQIVEGNGVLVTGGTVESATPLSGKSVVVRQAIGPSSLGKVICGGTRRNVGPGDIIVIPPHTAHGFVAITTARIVYTVIRVDSQRLLELRDKAD